MSEPLLVVDNVRVEYEDVVAVNGVSFTVEPGMVYGLVGPNGAGKTSLIRAIASLIATSHGDIRVCGVDACTEPREALRHVGLMPDAPPLYEDLTVREFMELFASSYGLPPVERTSRIESLLTRVQLMEKVNVMAGTLSRGMRQRLFLAKTLLHDPDVLLLDEPASGLDPLARMDLGNILRDLGKNGKAVLVSSHILPEMAEFCNSVGIMERGNMILSGRVDEILKRMEPGTAITLRLVAPDARLKEFLGTRGGVRKVDVQGASASFTMDGPPEDVAELLRQLVVEGFPVIDFHEQQGDLQDIFMKVSTGVVA